MKPAYEVAKTNVISFGCSSQTMTSLELAELSGKQHGNVIRDIEKILSNVGINQLKFESVYTDKKGEERKMYRLPKSETLLVTSKWSDVQRWKIIQKLEENTPDPTSAEYLLLQAQKLVQHEREIKELQHQQKETACQVRALVDGEDYFTVVGFANIYDIKVDSKRAARIGRLASKVCQSKGWKTGTANHPLYGQVNTYPKAALKAAMESEE